MYKTSERLSSRARLLSAAAVVAIAFGTVGTASAQSTASADTAASVESIEVTATRTVRDGYEAPTPTTVIGAAEIAAKAPANLADFVNQLPSLAGSSTPRSTISAISAGNGGINALNLRNLGLARTLVLLDGQRVGPSSLTGLVDINQFPQALVSRVDVVTGGASASWGSDAVAGVVNFLIDKEFTGIKGEVRAGVTNERDDENVKASLTGGAVFADGRGHILVSGEYARNDGIQGVPRDWYAATKVFTNPAYTATNGQPQLLVRPNSGFATATPGGIITTGPLRGTYFGPGGSPAQFNYGSIVSGNIMTGGDSAYADFGRSGDLMPSMDRQNFFSRASYDITDQFRVFGQFSYGRSASDVTFGNQYNFGNITIRGDNAFIPASVAARVTALNIATFSLGSLNEDLGLVTTTTDRSSYRPVIGAEGEFAAFGSDWKWNAYAQRSITHNYVASDVSITANYNNAIDSVRNSNGAIVCRSTLTNPTNGCVPYNIFGTGVNSQAARNYVNGTAWIRTRLKEDVVAANFTGNPFSTWAGPVSVATGIEHRRERVAGTNDPLSPSRAYFLGNYLGTRGGYNVTEGYLETVVPLAKDTSFARTLDLNGAVRATDYSISGFVTTWKVGLTYSPIDDITVRATRSRDIRAPNLSELFQANQTGTTNVLDPASNNANATIFSVTSGNLGLVPEKADTTGLGIVVRPRFISGFAASVDYYNIDIKQAIATVGAQILVNQCFSGNTALCSKVVRNSAGTITTVLLQPINLSKQISRGVDFEASLRRPFMDGNLTLRALATHYLKNYSNNGINKPTDTVGTNNGGGSAAASLPHWTYVGSIAWDRGPVALMLTARGFSEGVYNTSYVECLSACPTSTTDNMTIDNNHLPSAVYVDFNVKYKLRDDIEVFGSVENLANKAPAHVAWSTGGAPLDTSTAQYDVIGRRFSLGMRFKM